MEDLSDIRLIGRKQVSGDKYKKNLKIDDRIHLQKKYLRRAEELQREIPEYDEATLKVELIDQDFYNKYYAIQAYKKMAQNVLKVRNIHARKVKSLQKESKKITIRSERSDKRNVA